MLALLPWKYVYIPVVVQAAVAVLISLKFRKLGTNGVFSIAAFPLPLLTFVLFAGSMAYFLSAPHDPEDGGDGPAFFGILTALVVIPSILLVCGAVSGFLAVTIRFHLLPMICRRWRAHRP